MKTLLLISLTVTVILFSCQKKDIDKIEPVNNDNLLSDNAHILDTAAIFSITSTLIVINKASTSLKPKIGDILIAPPTLVNSFGQLSKVINVTESASQFSCDVVQSNLNDAFKQLFITSNYLDTFSANGSFLTGSNLSVEFNANNTIANGIGLSGIIKFKIPTTRVEFVKRSGTLRPDKVLIQSDFNIDESNLEIKNTTTSAINVITEKTLITFNLPSIIILIPIGPIVIPIALTQQLNIKTLPISISGKAKWTVFPKVSATLGVKYENSNWTNLCSYSINSSSSSLFQGDFTPSVSLLATATIIKPVYEIKPYGLNTLKTFFEVPNNLELTVQSPSPNYSLKYKLDVTGGIKQSFWTGVEQEYSITGHIVEKIIMQGDWPILQPGDVVSPTGRVWMDRNLGATRVATSSNDYLAYGSLYQWGRNSDDHQLINWASGTSGSPFNGTTTTLSYLNNPGHNLFIISTLPVSYPDWRNPQNNNLWQGVNGLNNPCPLGYRLPTAAEFNAEVQLFPQNNSSGAFQSVLKLPTPPNRNDHNGVVGSGVPLGWGFYWTSTIGSNTISSVNLQINGAQILLGDQSRGVGNCVRCIKN